MSYAVLFPGQGSQSVGMGADVFAAMPELLGAAADAVLGWSLREMCLQGPEEALTRTEHAQPALFAVSFALWSALAARVGTAPPAYRGAIVPDYGRHRLRPPPPGFAWVRAGDRYLLVSRQTGQIFDIIGD